MQSIHAMVAGSGLDAVSISSVFVSTNRIVNVGSIHQVVRKRKEFDVVMAEDKK